MKKHYSVIVVLLLAVMLAVRAWAAPAAVAKYSDVIAGGPTVDVRTFATLSAAVASSKTAGKTILISTPQTCNDLTIPGDRELMFVRGGSIIVAAGKTLTVSGQIRSGLYQIFNGAGAVTGLLESNPEWFGAVGDAATDDSSAILKAANSTRGDGTLWLNALYGVNPDVVAINKAININSRKTGHSYNGTSAGLKALANGGYIMKLGQLTTGSFIVGLKMQNVLILGNNKTMSEGGLVLYGLANPDFGWSCINGVVGNGLFMREVWQANFDRMLFRSITATGAGQAVVSIGDKYNSDNNLNCNILKFSNGCQFEGNLGPYFRSSGDSNLDGLQIDHNEFENNAAGGQGPWPVFDLIEGGRIQIHNNEFMNFSDSASYNILLNLGSDGSSRALVYFHNNWLNRVTANTIPVQLGYSGYVSFKDNYTDDSTGARMAAPVNGSRYAIDYENARPLDNSSSNLNTKSINEGFISIHKIAHNTNKFVTDSDTFNVERSVMGVNVAGEPFFYLGNSNGATGNQFRDYPQKLCIAVRAKSATGAGKLQVQVRTTDLSQQTVGSTWGIYKFYVSPSQMAAMGDNASDRFLVKVGSSNPAGETVYVDGVWIIPFPAAQSGAGAPATTPSFIGEEYLDAAAGKWYKAKGTGSSGDWVLLN